MVGLDTGARLERGPWLEIFERLLGSDLRNRAVSFDRSSLASLIAVTTHLKF